MSKLRRDVSNQQHKYILKVSSSLSSDSWLTLTVTQMLFITTVVVLDRNVEAELQTFHFLTVTVIWNIVNAHPSLEKHKRSCVISLLCLITLYFTSWLSTSRKWRQLEKVVEERRRRGDSKMEMKYTGHRERTCNEEKRKNNEHSDAIRLLYPKFPLVSFVNLIR